MSNKIGQIGSSTYEDGVDNLVSGYTQKYAKEYFDKVKNYVGDDGSIPNEALLSMINTLQFGISNAVQIAVTEYAVTRLGVLATALWAYIKSGTVIKKVRNMMQNDKLPKKGKFARKVFGMLSNSGAERDRIEIAKMGSNMGDTLIQSIGTERLVQSSIQGTRYKHMGDTANNSMVLKTAMEQKASNLFLHKCRTGSWNKSREDRDLFQKATGYDFRTGSSKWTADFVAEINRYSEYTKAGESEVYNQTKAMIDLLASNGFKKV